MVLPKIAVPQHLLLCVGMTCHTSGFTLQTAGLALQGPTKRQSRLAYTFFTSVIVTLKCHAAPCLQQGVDLPVQPQIYQQSANSPP